MPQQVRTPLDWGLALLEAALRHHGPFRPRVFDSWYLADALGSMARSHTQDWGSVRQQKRQLETNRFILTAAVGTPVPLEGPPRAVADLIALSPQPASQAVAVRDKTAWTFPWAGRLPGRGKGRLVLRCAKAELPGTAAILVPNRVDWSAPRIIALDWHRWPMEPFSQDSKGPLGLDEYRMRNAEALGKHGWLVFVASSLWHLDCLPSSLPTGNAPLKAMGEACRQQAHALMQAVLLSAHDRLQLGQRAEDSFASLFAKQQTVLAR